MRKLALFVVLSLTASTSIRAALIFNLSNDSTVERRDSHPSFDLSQAGLTATLTALLDGSGTPSAVLNGTKSSFGVNITTGGADKSSQIDGAYGVESVQIRFDKPVRFDSIDVSGIGSADSGTLTAGNAPAETFRSSGTVSAGQTVEPGNSATVSWATGNGFSLNSFAVTLVKDANSGPGPVSTGHKLSAVPEPSSLPLELGALALAFLAFRRRRAAKS